MTGARLQVNFEQVCCQWAQQASRKKAFSVHVYQVVAIGQICLLVYEACRGVSMLSVQCLRYALSVITMLPYARFGDAPYINFCGFLLKANVSFILSGISPWH